MPLLKVQILNRSFQLLKILKSNLKKMQILLSYGDGESAILIAYKNERIIFLLESNKKKNAKSRLAEMQVLADDCILLQEDCDRKLVSITSEYKKEYNIHTIKRQLLEHLNNT